MRNLTRLLMASMLLLAVHAASAQEKVITGVVSSDADNTPLQGVTVQNKITNQNSQTNNAGFYSIRASKGQILAFSFVGYTAREITVGDANVINIRLSPADKQLGEVVVTALGIRKSKRALGYSTNDVKGEELAQTQRDNILNSLAGRVPGVRITGTTGMPGSSSSIILRGMNSISGNNQPLFVIDGLPIDNQTFHGNNFVGQTENRTIDFTNRISDLNPEDIESITILKGPEAAALYGIDAANGAIVITTKKGQPGQGKLSYGYNFGFEKLGRLPDIPRVYARGSNGIPSDNTFSNFGPRYTAADTLYDNTDGFFQNGILHRHNITFEGGVQGLTYRVSGGYSTRTGVVPTTKYDRINVTASMNAALLKKLKLDVTMQYINTKNQKVSKGNNSFYLAMLAWPADNNMSDYLLDNGARQKITTGTEIENPFFDVYKNNLYDRGNRFITNIGLNYDLTDWLSVSARAGADVYSTYFSALYHPESNRAGGTIGGSLDVSNQTNRTITLQTYLQARKTFLGDKLNVTGRVGNAVYDFDDNIYSVRGEKFLEPGFNSLNNTDPLTQRQKTTRTQKRVVGLFGDLNFAYSNFAYLTLTGRNDWTSTLPLDNNSFFYPSASLSFIPSEFYKGSGVENVMNFLKLRASIAQVGKDARPYSTNPALEAQTTTGGGFSYGFTAPNPLLRPEKVTSREFGFEAQFLRNRISIDAAYYKTKSVDQIINGLRISYGTGFVLKNINGGELQNDGIELLLKVTPVRKKDFIWDISFNYNQTNSKLTRMPNNLPEYYNSDTWLYGNVRNGARLGGALTTLTARYSYAYNDAGQLLISPSTGLPILVDNPIWPAVADRNPDFTGGIANNLTYKNWNLSFLWDIRKGGDVYNATGLFLYNLGLHPKSVEGREVPLVFDGILKDGLENTDKPTKNNIVIEPYYNNSFYSSSVIDQEFIEKDVNWVRLRDVTLSYKFPDRWLKGTRTLKAASVAVTATDLLLWTNYTGGDPGVNGTTPATGGTGSAGIDFGNLPVSKTFNLSLRISL